MIVLVCTILTLIGCGMSPPTTAIDLAGKVLEGRRYVIVGVKNNRPIYELEWHEIHFKDAINYRWTWGPEVRTNTKLQIGWEEGTYDIGTYNPESKSVWITFNTLRSSDPLHVKDHLTYTLLHDPAMNSYIFLNMTWHVKGAVPKPIPE